jgi:hypothetical protein
LLLCPSHRYLDDIATKEVDVRGALFNLTQRIFKAFCNIGPRFSHLAGGLKFISNFCIMSAIVIVQSWKKYWQTWTDYWKPQINLNSNVDCLGWMETLQ